MKETRSLPNEHRKTMLPELENKYGKLMELRVDREVLHELGDEQARELLKSMLYFMIRKQDGYA